MASFLSQNYMNMKCKILTTPLIQSPLCGMFRAQLLQLCFWSAWRLLVFYLKCLHSPTLCFAGQEQNGATHNGGESEGDTGLTSPVPPQRKKLAPPSISPPSIPLSSPTSRKPAHPRPALRPLDSDFSRHEVKIQAGQRSDPMVTTNGESRVTVSRAQSFQGWRPQLKETTGEAQGVKARSFSEKSSICRPPTRPPDPPSRLLNKTPNEDSPASYVASKTKFFESASRHMGSSSPNESPAASKDENSK